MILYMGHKTGEYFLGETISDHICSMIEDGLHEAQLAMGEPNIDSVFTSGLPAAVYYGSINKEWPYLTNFL